MANPADRKTAPAKTAWTKDKDDAPAERRPWLTRRQKIWGAVAVVSVSALAILWAVADDPEDDKPRAPKGRPVCPPTAAPTAGTRPGDYLILVLEDRGSTFEEPVWAQVLSRAPEGDAFLVRLLSQTGEEGAVHLSKDKHGFRTGDMLEIEASCVWDTMKQPDTGGKGQLFCGFEGEQVGGDDPVHVADLRAGDEVQVLASTRIGTDAHLDRLWVKVDGLSRTKNVVYGTIISTVHFPIHGFRQWQEIQFGRDCIFDVRRP